MAEREVGHENPRASDKDEIENLGITVDIMHVDEMFCASHTNVEECNSVAANPSPNITLSLNGKVDLNPRIGRNHHILIRMRCKQSVGQIALKST